MKYNLIRNLNTFPAFSGGIKIELPMPACKEGIDPLHQKFNLKANVMAAAVICILAIMGVRHNRQYLTPRIIQNDIDSVRNPRHARYNRAIGLATANALPGFLLSYIIYSGLVLTLSRVKCKHIFKRNDNL